MGKELDQLKPVLEAIPRQDVAIPQIPIADFLQESHDLETLVAQPDVHKDLVAVGVDEKLLSGLATSVAAARQAQSDWVVAFDRTKSEGQRQTEDKARNLRSEMAAACRWNLRDDRVALATVSAVAPEGGLADLVQDLNDLAHLVESRKAAFKSDKTFDGEGEVKQARELAKELEQGISTEQLENEQARAKDLRDRAFTHLYDEVSLVRDAGRYAFRASDKLRGRFASAYNHHRTKSTVAEPPPPVQHAAPAAPTATAPN